MSDADQEEKTEEPSGKRLGDAQSKGQVAKSQEVNNLFMIGAATLVIAIFTADMATNFRFHLAGLLATAHETALNPTAFRDMFAQMTEFMVTELAAPIAILIVAGLAATRIQHPIVITLDKLKPKLSSFNLVSGVKQKFSLRNLVEFGKDVFKLLIVGSVVLAVIWPQRDRLGDILTVDVSMVLPLVRMVTLEMLTAILLVLVLIAIVDFAYQRFDHRKKLRMTKVEVKDERKQLEGDPKIKQRLHSIRVARHRERIMAAVPMADVVITNPTHYAVALQYVAETMTAPKVIAKGQDLLARRIREIAEEHDIPIVENPPLARALHESAEIDQEIPVEHYKAVAEIIGFVMRYKGGLRSARQGP